MSMFKYIAFSLLLSVPMVSGATTTVLEGTLGGPTSPTLSSFDGPGPSIVTVSPGFFADQWSLNVDPGEVASISFKSFEFSPFLTIDGFTASSGGAYSLTNLGPGLYNFLVSGTASGIGGGQYGVGVSAVPLPAAVWLFGSAMLGFLSLAKRRNQI
ncbi:MAG: hypothetical protein PHY16_17760 [Methylobacter sp.]|nr:hypothetical protein [Methylobacter sp.]